MKIKEKELLCLDKYIEESLYNKEFGYYMKKNPFGEKGDFITAPNISILFSEMIAIWIISFWENLNKPKKFNLVELGAGNGEMMKTLINTFDKFPLFKDACSINILEKSKLLKNIQRKNIKNQNVKWLKNLNELIILHLFLLQMNFLMPCQLNNLSKKKTNGMIDMLN